MDRAKSGWLGCDFWGSVTVSVGFSICFATVRVVARIVPNCERAPEKHWERKWPIAFFFSGRARHAYVQPAPGGSDPTRTAVWVPVICVAVCDVSRSLYLYATLPAHAPVSLTGNRDI